SYAARGWRVLPVRAGTRQPHLKGWPRAATTYAPTIRTWWGRWPDAAVGIATGRGSSLVVLDRDPRNGSEESLAALVAECGPLPGWVLALARTEGERSIQPSRKGGQSRKGLVLAAEDLRRAFADAWEQAGLVLHPGEGFYRCPFEGHARGDAEPSLHIHAEA